MYSALVKLYLIAATIQFGFSLTELESCTARGYLAVCKGYNILPNDLTCPEKRSLFIKIAMKSPEEMIIRKIPLIPLVVQNFLIPRMNICTGFDSSNLSCDDITNILPLVANFAGFPALGQLMGSPAGQFISEQVMCKDLCENPAVPAGGIICGDKVLPKIPFNLPSTNISFTPPSVSFPDFNPGFGDWGNGSGFGDLGGGSSCGGFLSSCGSGGGSGSGGNTNYLCSLFPKLWLCDSSNSQYFPNVVIDDSVPCEFNGNPWTIGQMLDFTSSTGRLYTTVFSSTISKCVSSTIPAFPSISKPVITVIQPLPGQSPVAGQQILVKGYVNDVSAFVKIQNIQVATYAGLVGAYFEKLIDVPADGKIIVQAASKWGTRADDVIIQLILPPTGVAKVSIGRSHACAIENGRVKCWGDNDSGVLGSSDPDPTQFHLALPIAGLSGTAQDVSAGYFHSCAVVDGAAYCWGNNSYGQLGSGDRISRFTPSLVSGLENGVFKIVAGYQHTCAILANGVKCWGRNVSDFSPGTGGQLGNNTSLDSDIPVDVVGISTGVTAIALGDAHTCALVNGGMKCWGANFSYQLGNGSFLSQSLVPVDVTDLQSGVTSIATGGTHTCAVKNEGAICWGANYRGQVGTGDTSGIAVQLPSQFFGLTSDIISISAGRAHTCALLRDSTAKCWGANNSSQLGNGQFLESYVPSTVLNINFIVKSLVSGAESNFIILDDNRAKCWGQRACTRPTRL